MRRRPALLLSIALTAWACGSSGTEPGPGPESRTYTTTFTAAENPISQNGNWINGGEVGLDWHNVVTVPGQAMGTDAVVPWSDSTAILSGAWKPNQTVEGTVYSANPSTVFIQQVELRLRTTIAPHSITGYEIFFRCIKNELGSVGIVRWNGPLANYTYLLTLSGAQYGVATGDVVKASIYGTVINVYINNVQVAQVVDSMFSSGSPGMGFNFGCDGTYGDFGFSKFSAYEITTSHR